MNKDFISFKNFRIERLSESNLHYAVELFKIVFNAKTNVEAIKKKHLEGHCLNKYFGYIAIDIETNLPAGYFAVYLRDMQYKGKVFLAGQSGDTMINLKFRKEGLFFELANQTIKLCKENEIKIITGFPNKYSYLTFVKKLGFKNLSKLINLTFLENSFEIHRITNRHKLLKYIHIIWLKLIFKFLKSNITYFENSNSKDNHICFVNRDQYFFKYRSNDYKMIVKINNINLFLKINFNSNSIEIGDIDLIKEIDLQKLIKKLCVITVFSGLRFLNFTSTSNGVLIKKLQPLSIKSDSNSFVVGVSYLDEIIEDKLSLNFIDSDAF
jgi:hypothetical protein